MLPAAEQTQSSLYLRLVRDKRKNKLKQPACLKPGIWTGTWVKQKSVKMVCFPLYKYREEAARRKLVAWWWTKQRDLIGRFRTNGNKINTFKMMGEEVEVLEEHKYLVVHLDNRLDWGWNSDNAGSHSFRSERKPPFWLFLNFCLVKRWTN